MNYTSKELGANISNIPNSTVGRTRKLARACILCSNSNLSGNRYNYKANTTITILQNISASVDKIRVNVTGRVAYINKNNYTNVTISSTQDTTRKTKACTQCIQNQI